MRYKTFGWHTFYVLVALLFLVGCGKSLPIPTNTPISTKMPTLTIAHTYTNTSAPSKTPRSTNTLPPMYTTTPTLSLSPPPSVGVGETVFNEMWAVTCDSSIRSDKTNVVILADTEEMIAIPLPASIENYDFINVQCLIENLTSDKQSYTLGDIRVWASEDSADLRGVIGIDIAHVSNPEVYFVIPKQLSSLTQPYESPDGTQFTLYGIAAEGFSEIFYSEPIFVDAGEERRRFFLLAVSNDETEVHFQFENLAPYLLD